MKKYFIILPLITFLPILLYLYKFGSLSFSNDIKDWSNFSTFVSGTVGLVLAAINIMLIYQLTETAKQIEDKNAETSLRIDKYHNLMTEFDKLTAHWRDIIKDYDEQAERIEKIKPHTNYFLNFLINFMNDYKFIFEKLDEKKSFIELTEYLSEFDESKNFITLTENKQRFSTMLQEIYL